MRIVSFEETNFVTHDDRVLLRIAIGDWDFCNPFRIEIKIGGVSVYSHSAYAVLTEHLIPRVTKDTECEVILHPFEDTPVITRKTLHPIKEWKIAFLYSSHEDLGYCGYVNRLERTFYESLCHAMRLCREHEDFRYMIEHVEWLSGFDAYASADEKEELKRLFAEKRIELNAPPCGIHTHWAEAGQLYRSMLPAVEDAAQTWGIHPECVIYADLSGISAQTIPAYRAMGIRYCGILWNAFRRPNAKKKLPRIFRWQAQNGRDSLLFYCQCGYSDPLLHRVFCDVSRQYEEGEFIFDETKARKTREKICEMLTELGDVPYSVLPVSFYDDREDPTTLLLTVCHEMNRRWKYPTFSMELPSVMLSEIEREAGDRLPCLTGDLTDQWADFATIAPTWLSEKREGMRNLYPAELLDILPSHTGERIDGKALTRLGAIFDEHCWATSSKHPQKMHRFNMIYTKQQSAERILAETRAHLGKTDGDTVSVHNYLPYARTDPLRLPAGSPLPAGVAAQRLPDGTCITEPFSVGPTATRTFASAEADPGMGTELACREFETPYYRVRLDRDTMRIESITDKTDGRELLDDTSPYDLGQYLYVLTEEKTSPELFVQKASPRRMTVYEGSVAFAVELVSYEEQSGADIKAVFVFGKQEKEIGITVRFENAAGLMGDYSDRYKKNIFFALPFAGNAPRFYTQLAGGGAHETEEKLGISPLDFTVCENWVAVEDHGHGIGVYSADMPVFHTGAIRYNQFSEEPCRDSAGLFLYAASNRANNLIYRTVSDCQASYRLTLLPYNGSWRDQLPAWSRRRMEPLRTGGSHVLGSPFVLEGDLRILSVRSTGEHTVQIDLCEESGRAQDAVLTIGIPFTDAAETTPDGRYLRPCRIKNGKLRFKTDAYGYTSLCLTVPYSMKHEKKETGDIFDIRTVEIENSRMITAFTKSSDCTSSAFTVIGDGTPVCTVPADEYRTQTVELDRRYQTVTIRKQ